jgi:hypothetical protein
MATLHPVYVTDLSVVAVCSQLANAEQLAARLNTSFGAGTAVVADPILFNPSHVAAIAHLESLGLEQV